MVSVMRARAEPEYRLVRDAGSTISAISPAVYARAVVELCARIWLELEGLTELLDCEDRLGEASELCLRAATLRLDLLVLSAECESAIWRSWLGAQHDILHAMLNDVLDAIAFEPVALTRSAIEHAQDCLFEEVIFNARSAAAQDTAIVFLTMIDSSIDDLGSLRHSIRNGETAAGGHDFSHDRD